MEHMSWRVTIDWGKVAFYLAFGIFVLAVAIAGLAAWQQLLNPPQSAIDVFSTRFDECMATEKFTRDECVIYAKGE